MIDEALFSDLVDLYNSNVKAFKQQNSGLIIDKVYPLLIEDIEEMFPKHELINHAYIAHNYLGFTVNPAIRELNIKNHVGRVEITPDISWERKINN